MHKCSFICVYIIWAVVLIVIVLLITGCQSATFIGYRLGADNVDLEYHRADGAYSVKMEWSGHVGDQADPAIIGSVIP